MDQRPKCKARYHKTLRGKQRQYAFYKNCSKSLFDPFPRVVKIKPKTNKWDLIKRKETKGNYKQDEKTALRMGENNCKRSN